ncbi:MAG: preprotein translocase subunit SecE [Planctomycetes bacterium]|nr:preprotein translocase subunit SecE [Planctomycetota bacterium]
MTKEETQAPVEARAAYFSDYREGEGRLTRSTAFYIMLGLTAWAGYSLNYTLEGLTSPVDFSAASLDWLGVNNVFGVRVTTALLCGATFFLLALVFLKYRVLDRPRLADLLVDTEKEMRLVSWPAYGEVYTSSVVVVVFVVILVSFLWLSDQVLYLIAKYVLRIFE